MKSSKNCGLSLTLASLLVGQCCFGQTKSAPTPVSPGGAPTVAPISVGPDGKPVLPPGVELPPGVKIPGMPAKPKPGAKPTDAKAKAASSAPKTIKRPDKPTKPADPRELMVRPDVNGTVSFSFSGQPWPDVMEWLAEVSNMSFNWQELPGDYLNLTTRRPYKVAEARDLINGHLISRGYTILIENETMQVIKIKDLGIASIPRVKPEELADRQPNEFVRVSFPLDWLVAESAVEELKPMLGRHGKLHQLATTNRVEAIDTVANLRAIYQLLQEEQSDQGQQKLIRSFVLKHRRAVDVIDLVKELVGVKSKAPAAGGRQQNIPGLPPGVQMPGMPNNNKKKTTKAAAPEVHIVLNQRENSILAQAPPNKMAEIEQAIKEIDKPSSEPAALLMNPDRMQVYRLTTFAPKPFVDLLNEMGNLDPQTQLRIDEENNAIIAYASAIDHASIRSMMKRIDGSVRQFEVIKLRRLEAAYVAGTIQFMFKQEEEDKNSRNSYPYYGGFSFGSRRQQPKRNKDKFKVDADVENNRLLLWANEIELGEIRNLLAKLGEDPMRTGQEELFRVYEVGEKQSPEAVLEQIRRHWNRRNPLNIAPSKTDTTTRENATEDADASASTTHRTLIRTKLIQTQTRDFETTAPSPLAPPATQQSDPAIEKFFRELNAPARQPENEGPKEDEPINISVRSDGKIIVTSRDPAALYEMEQLLSQLVPRNRDYKVFRLKHTAPLGVALTLEDFFEKPEKKGNGIEYDPFFGFMPSRGKKDEGDVRLSRRRTPKFIPDNYTSTILVQGADRSQLQTIAQLIELYDQPEASDSRSLRRTKMFPIKYSQATVIATAIKDVFRDLLSGNDKALQNQKEESKSTERVYTYMAGQGDDEEDAPVKFKGLLSIGIDEYSNTLIVSSTAGLLDTIGQIIENLDQRAAPKKPEYKVVRLKGDISPTLLQKRIEKLFGAKQTKTDRKKPKTPQPGVTPQIPGTGNR